MLRDALSLPPHTNASRCGIHTFSSFPFPEASGALIFLFPPFSMLHVNKVCFILLSHSPYSTFQYLAHTPNACARLGEEAAARDEDARDGALRHNTPATWAHAAKLLAARARRAAPDAHAVTNHVTLRAILLAQVVAREEAADGAAQDADTVRPQ